MNEAIFLVEDDLEDIAIFKEAFTGVGAGIIRSFPNAFDAIRHLEKLDEDSLPKLLITDYNMPRIDGFNLATYLKRNDKFKNIQIVVMSGVIHENEKHRLISAGVSRIYKKPSNFDEYKNIAEELAHLAKTDKN